MLHNNQLLLAKVETTRGTDATPVKSANATLTFPVDPKIDVQVIDYAVVRGSISAAKKRLGRKMVNLAITCPLKGSGTAGVAPEFGALLQSCAMVETVGASDVVYKPTNSDANMESCTIYFFLDGIAVKAVGCMGNFVINPPAGGLPTITFNMRGRLLSRGDVALPTGAVFQTTEPVVVESGGVSFGAFNTAVVRSLSYDSGNNIFDRMDINSPEGVLGTGISARDPKYTATVEATVEATKAWWANFIGRVEEAIDLVIGTTAGNIITIGIPKACVDTSPDPAVDNNIVTYNLSGQALESTAEDNITITFT